MTTSVPSLVEICVQTCISYRAGLSDLGYLPADLCRRIIVHLEPAQLKAVEDATKEGSQRDLSWHTWHRWYNFYTVQIGHYSQEEHPDRPLLPLSTPQPQDYVPPKNVQAPTADWRAMLERELSAESRRAEALVSKLRAGYKAAERDKAARKAEQVLIPPPRKRHRVSTPGQPRQPASVKQLAAPATTAQQVQHAKMAGVMKGIGLAPKQQTTVRQTSGAPVRHAVKVTKTVIVHKNIGSTTSTSPSSPASYRNGTPALQAGKQSQAQLPKPVQDKSKLSVQDRQPNGKPLLSGTAGGRSQVPATSPGKPAQSAGGQPGPASSHTAPGIAARGGAAQKPAASGLFKHFK